MRYLIVTVFSTMWTLPEARWLYQMKEKGKILSLWLETVVYGK